MKIPIWKILSIFSIVANWSAQALADNKVTMGEALDLVHQLATALGVPTEYDVNEYLK